MVKKVWIDEDGVVRELQDEFGREIPDDRPMVLPSGFRRPETLAEQVQRLVRSHVSRMAADRGDETFEEAEDFDVGEDVEPSTPYETFFDPVLGKELTPAEFRARESVYRKQYIDAQKRYFEHLDRTEVMHHGRSGLDSSSRRDTSEPGKSASASGGVRGAGKSGAGNDEP